MTEPIKLYFTRYLDGYLNPIGLRSPEEIAKNTRAVSYEIVELCEVRRCKTCASFVAACGACTSWGSKTEPEGHCYRHESTDVAPQPQPNPSRENKPPPTARAVHASEEVVSDATV